MMEKETSKSEIALIFNAISFYNAYVNLEELNATDELSRLLVPMLVNGAFSIELTLKAILTKQGVSYKKDHNLAVLFYKLPIEIQQKIWEWVAEKAPEYADEQKRHEELVLMSEAFKKWRYYFEEKDVPAFDARLLSVFANAAIGVMFSLGYDVEIVIEDLDKSAEEIEELFENNRKSIFESNLEEIKKRVNF